MVAGDVLVRLLSAGSAGEGSEKSFSSGVTNFILGLNSIDGIYLRTRLVRGVGDIW